VPFDSRVQRHAALGCPANSGGYQLHIGRLVALLQLHKHHGLGDRTIFKRLSAHASAKLPQPFLEAAEQPPSTDWHCFKLCVARRQVEDFNKVSPARLAIDEPVDCLSG
jgi:hypothetical protein